MWVIYDLKNLLSALKHFLTYLFSNSINFLFYFIFPLSLFSFLFSADGENDDCLCLRIYSLLATIQLFNGDRRPISRAMGIAQYHLSVVRLSLACHEPYLLQSSNLLLDEWKIPSWIQNGLQVFRHKTKYSSTVYYERIIGY